MRHIPRVPVLFPKRRPRRRGRALPAPRRSARLYVEIAPSLVHLFRFLLEAEDNLGIMTVADRWRAVLMVRFSPHQEGDMRLFLADMCRSIPFSVIERPGCNGDASAGCVHKA